MKAILLGLFVGVAVLALGYLAGCAAAGRWLTFREWWGF